MIDYTSHDIQTFIRVAKQKEASDEFQSLKKLLAVKDKIEIFRGILTNELKALVYDVRFKRYKFKEYIIKENDDSVEIFFLLKGECHTFLGEKLIAKLYEGTTFGEIGVITNSKRSASVVAASKEVLLLSFKINENNLDFNARGLAIFYRNLAATINDKLQKLNIVATKK